MSRFDRFRRTVGLFQAGLCSFFFAAPSYVAAIDESVVKPIVLEPASFETPPAEKKDVAADEAEAEAIKKKRADLKQAISRAYKPLFYDNRYQYLCNPLYDDWFFGEPPLSAGSQVSRLHGPLRAEQP